MIKVLDFYKKNCAARMEDTAQLSLYFHVENVSSKKQKKLIIYDTIQPILSGFHQNDSHVSGHIILITDELENVDQGQNSQKCSFLTREYS